LVFHDILNMTFAPRAKFVRQYADAAGLIRDAVEHYREDVEHRAFPTDAESYHLPAEVRQAIEADAEAPALAAGKRITRIRQV
jgi:3-methyl-2-oxobutanoate hydroxymethyltransferase